MNVTGVPSVPILPLEINEIVVPSILVSELSLDLALSIL